MRARAARAAISRGRASASPRAVVSREMGEDLRLQCGSRLRMRATIGDLKQRWLECSSPMLKVGSHIAVGWAHAQRSMVEICEAGCAVLTAGRVSRIHHLLRSRGAGRTPVGANRPRGKCGLSRLRIAL